MNDNSNFDSLERLLAQTPTIADRGFSERISAELAREPSKTITQRTKVFAVAGCIWLVLVISLASPIALFADLTGLLTLLDFSEQLSVLSLTSAPIDYAVLQASYPSILAFVLSVAAIYSLLLKN